MIGSIVLSLALVCSLFTMVMYYLNFRGYQNTLAYARIGYHATAMLVIIASTILWYFLLTHAYEYKYVYSYSNNLLPTGLLLASFWGGQEGSFMLWLLLTSIIGIILQSYTSKRGDLEPRAMAVFTLATTFLLIMVSPLFKNPFEFIWSEPVFLSAKSINASFLSLPAIQSFIFTDNSNGGSFVKMTTELVSVLKTAGISVNQFIIDGKGLNPQLLNFWMQIHPPILFTGFSMATVPFVFAMAALLKNDYKDWVRQSFPWVLAGTGILGLGVTLGGYWAYEMLGWGGYWAWDPVENSSLIPWLVGVASIHTLLVQRKTQAKGGIGRFAKTNLILCLMTYILVLYSTFLTRSGVLGDASVHSFVDPGMIVYLFLLIFIGTFILLGLGMVIYRWRYLSAQHHEEEGILSRDLGLFTATIVLCASAIIVLVGTSAPLFGTSVDTAFYNEMHLPLAIIIGLLNGLSLRLKWKNTGSQELLRKLIVPVAFSILFTGVIVIAGGVHDIMLILLAFSALFTIYVNAEIAINIIKGNLRMLGAYVAHIGIALFILGVLGSAGYSEEMDIDLIKNEPKEVFGYQLMFTGFHGIENDTKYAFNIELKKGGDTYHVSPVMYISDFNNGLMREPSILVTPTKDIYVSPIGYEEKGGGNASSVSLQHGAATDFNGVKVTFIDFDFPAETREAMMAGKDFKIGVILNAEKGGVNKEVRVALESTGGTRNLTTASLPEFGINIGLVSLDASGKVDLNLSAIDAAPGETTQNKKEVLSVTASIKPFVSFVWVGVLIMVIGFFVSVARRLRESLTSQG